MAKKVKSIDITYVVAAIVVIVAAILILPNLGLFSIYTVGASENLNVKYQALEGSCIVRIEKLEDRTTTFVGPYDFEGKGEENVNLALSIGWVDTNTSESLLGVLQTYYPGADCSPLAYALLNQTTGNETNQTNGNNQTNQTNSTTSNNETNQTTTNETSQTSTPTEEEKQPFSLNLNQILFKIGESFEFTILYLLILIGIIVIIALLK